MTENNLQNLIYASIGRPGDHEKVPTVAALLQCLEQELGILKGSRHFYLKGSIILSDRYVASQGANLILGRIIVRFSQLLSDWGPDIFRSDPAVAAKVDEIVAQVAEIYGM